MADPTYTAGDPVVVFETPFLRGQGVGGRRATIARQMPEEQEGVFYEVTYADAVADGTPVIVTPDVLLLAAPSQ